MPCHRCKREWIHCECGEDELPFEDIRAIEQKMHVEDPTYDPDSDWLELPFPEERS